MHQLTHQGRRKITGMTDSSILSSATLFRIVRRLPFAILLTLTLTPTRIVAQTTTRWWPTSGTVILGGGHLSAETADDFIARLNYLAGGPQERIVIIPAADPGLYRRPGQMIPDSNPEDLRSWVESRC